MVRPRSCRCWGPARVAARAPQLEAAPEPEPGAAARVQPLDAAQLRERPELQAWLLQPAQPVAR